MSDEDRYRLDELTAKDVLKVYHDVLKGVEGPLDVQGSRAILLAACLIFVTREDPKSDAATIWAAASILAVMVGEEVGL